MPKHLIHAHSNVVTSSAPKLPAASRIEYGELAVNYAKGYETISLKNSQNEIVKFSSDAAIQKIITDNELVVSAALNDLNGRVTTISGDVSDLETAISNIDVDSMENVTYSELVTLRTNSGLKPGMHYRITDYTCTTTQTDTQSANHAFDIIVMALSENKLDENARAINHTGDTYFSTAKLAAWQVWYSLDNDTVRFHWADTTNGKGVIYRLIDEWGNDCPYDFKNIQFKRPLTDGEYDEDNGTDTWVYTFNLLDYTKDYCEDASIFGNLLRNDEGFVTGVYGNKMGVVTEYTIYPETHSDKLAFMLNNNVFLTIGENGDYYGCYSNTFGDDCSYNTFGVRCHSNTFGDNCYENTFVCGCYSNTFGNDCANNRFGDGCYYNAFGDGCNGNTFGNDCFDNVFGRVCHSNTFGDDCSDNTFGHLCNTNIFGNYCNQNTFGNRSANNSFRNRCWNNTFGSDIINVATLKDYCWYIRVENGVQYVSITTSQTTNDSNRLQNIIVGMGIAGTYQYQKVINHPTANDQFQTTYQAANSTVVDV